MTEFNLMLRRLRKRYIGKQLSLAGRIGCTDAAISFWERGRRLPIQPIQRRIIECFHDAGAAVPEVEELQAAYEIETSSAARGRCK